MENQKGSTAMLQRMLKIDYIRANKIMIQLENAGVVGPQNGIERKVLMNKKEYNTFLKENNFI